MMGHREQLKGGSEYDCLTKWRKYMKNHSGESHSVKKKFSRRVRREIKLEIRKEVS